MRPCWHLFAVVALLGSAVVLAMCGSRAQTTANAGAGAASPAAPGSNATYTVSGLVADLAGSRPVTNATISVTAGPSANRSTSSDASGRYALPDLLAGPATLHAAAPGYSAVDDTIAIPADTHADFRLPPVAAAPAPAPAGQCDPSLWPHMHDVQRIKTVTACMTVTGTIASVSTSDDGDYDMQLTLDPGFGSLLNAANVSKLNGNLQIEAICQAPIHPDVPDALRTCANFTGMVPIPRVGAHVQVTGVYVLDSDHGWMEIHPISVLR